jgi:hypothetical protein
MNPFELNYEEARAAIPELVSVYADRPVRENSGGMGFNHSFATWFILKSMQPRTVIESEVWKGHSTWIIEQACPAAELFCLDLNYSRLQYRSRRATYLQKDFAECDWSGIDSKATEAFLDDHQNAYVRLKELWWVGIRDAIFEDNFPVGQGDCYSLRQVAAGSGLPSMQMSKGYRGG